MTDDATRLARSLLYRLVASLGGRDWEDSNLGQAMCERQSLMAQIVGLGASAITPLIEVLSHPE